VYDGTARSTKVPRLNECTQYNLRIRCISTHGGAGSWCEPQTFITTRTPPPTIKNAPRVSQLAEHSWQIEWAPLKSTTVPSGDKLHYCLQLANANSSPRHNAEEWSTVL
jgi:hypothetical protein